MYDFITAEKELGHNECFIDLNLKKIEVLAYGFQKYELLYHKPLTIWFNFNRNIIRLQGSIPYFWGGHNFSQSKKEFIDALTYISKMVGVDLFNAKVLKFEYGKTIVSKQAAAIVLSNHISIGIKKPNIKEKCKFFEFKGDCIKLYDAVHNYKNKVPIEIRKNQMKAAGMVADKSYVEILMNVTTTFRRKLTTHSGGN